MNAAVFALLCAAVLVLKGVSSREASSARLKLNPILSESDAAAMAHATLSSGSRRLEELVPEQLVELRSQIAQTQSRQTDLEQNVAEIRDSVGLLNDMLQRRLNQELHLGAELAAEIRAVESRLNALAEQALHAVAEKAARDVIQQQLEDTTAHKGDASNQSSRKQRDG